MDQSTANRFDYLLMLGDSSLILGHRLGEWCGHGPVLEEDIGLINVALDLIGLSRNLLTYAGQIEGKGRDEDALAYLRDAGEFRNTLLTEQENGDFARTMLRQFFFDVYADLLYRGLSVSCYGQLAGIAQKAVKEMDYHLRHSTQWIYRLGDGTEESRRRTQEALDELWMFTGDLFETTDGDRELAAEGWAVAPESVKNDWTQRVTEVLQTATLQVPASSYSLKGSRQGRHTEVLGLSLIHI